MTLTLGSSSCFFSSPSLSTILSGARARARSGGGGGFSVCSPRETFTSFGGKHWALLGPRRGFFRHWSSTAGVHCSVINWQGFGAGSEFADGAEAENRTRVFSLQHLVRRSGSQLDAVKQSTIYAMGEGKNSKTKRIDAHLHVWAFPPEEGNPFPVISEPPLPGNAPYLVESMSEAGVDGALIVQSSAHKFDHSYVSRYPGKFVGCCLADPTDGGGGVREVERLISEEGYKAVRFNPDLWPSGQKMTNEVGKLMFSRAGELGAVVGIMCFKGLLLSIKEIEELCREFPTTKIMIDHYGFCKPSQTDDEAEAWKRLLGLAQFPQVYVKISAHFRVSRESYPYKDAWPLLLELLKVFGSKRLLWGSDFPFVTAECGYTRANAELPFLMAEGLRISESDLEDLLGGTALTLFKGGWADSPQATQA